MYTIPQILAAAKEAEVSEIDAQHICDTLVKRRQLNIEVGTFRKVIINDAEHGFAIGEIIKLIRIDGSSSAKYINKNGHSWWLYHYEQVKKKKKHPASKCSNAKCLICHSDKVCKVPDRQTLRANTITTN